MKSYHSTTKTPLSKEITYRLGKILILHITDQGLQYMKKSFKLVNKKNSFNRKREKKATHRRESHNGLYTYEKILNFISNGKKKKLTPYHIVLNHIMKLVNTSMCTCVNNITLWRTCRVTGTCILPQGSKLEPASSFQLVWMVVWQYLLKMKMYIPHDHVLSLLSFTLQKLWHIFTKIQL